MPRDIDHVVGAPEHEVVAVLVARGPIESRVDHLVGERLVVGVHVALVIAPDGRHRAGRQRRHDAEDALLVRSDFLAGLLVLQLDVVAVRGKRRRAELAARVFDTGARREDRPARFGLPVVVDDLGAERIGNPARGGLVERLAGEEQIAQRRGVVLLHPRRVLLLQHADRRGRGEHRRHLVVLNDLPPHARVGAHRHALVHDGRRAVDERPVDDVRVAHDPADVGGAEVGLPGFGAEDVAHRAGERHRVAAGVALNALRFPRRAAGVEDVRGLVGFEPRHRHLDSGELLALGGVVDITIGHTRHRLVDAAVDEDHVCGRRL